MHLHILPFPYVPRRRGREGVHTYAIVHAQATSPMLTYIHTLLSVLNNRCRTLIEPIVQSSVIPHHRDPSCVHHDDDASIRTMRYNAAVSCKLKQRWMWVI
eukprot:GHVU01053985.1.p1 GENE.GHVU01053985.1~~GHVU01053985.1.p1  ORF type:complete len:101 (-),score=1.39 GHVU01053985.1:326-628(-)